MSGANDKKKSRLGRGLSSLMGMNGSTDSAPDPIYADVSPQVGEENLARADSQPGTPAEIPLDLVRPNPHQPRRSFDDAALRELADSIKSNGVIQPIVVKRIPHSDGFELIAGERRLRAARLAGLTAIPAVIRDADRWSQAQMALVENIQRSDLNPIDRAAGYHALVSELGLTQADLAMRLGEDRSTITNHLRLLDLADPVQELLRAGTLSLGHAKVLGGVRDPAEQQRLAGLVVDQELSVRNLERILAGAAAPPAETNPRPAASAHLKDVELNMTRQVGLRVQVRAAARKGRGKVIIHYNNLDEFDNLVSRLGVTLDE